MSLSLPDFYDSNSVSQLFLERAALVSESAEMFAQKNKIKPSSEDAFRIAAFGIDVQVGFCHRQGSLFVPGAVEDTRRTIEWMYRNLDTISGLFFSLDTHRMFQIFHPAWWIDSQGNHPAPMTPIFAADVKNKKWIPVNHASESLEYVEKLEASGKYVLTIWPYHTLLGGLSHALVPAMMEASLFHAAARKQQTHFEIKGTHELTENYSVMSPEVMDLAGKKIGNFNSTLFKKLSEYDRIYIFGQAKSHCVLSTVNDLYQHAKAVDLSLLQKIYILEDAMSPVPAPPIHPLPEHLNFKKLSDQAIEQWRNAGMKIVKTSDTIVTP